MRPCGRIQRCCTITPRPIYAQRAAFSRAICTSQDRCRRPSKHELPPRLSLLATQAREQYVASSITRPITQDAPDYQTPRHGLISYLPQAWIPYAELIRLDKPTGTLYLYLPCLFSTLTAACLTTPIAAPSTVIGTSVLFLAGALVMRGAGCTINDLWDRNLDPHVSRTRLRPIARGAISPLQALTFTGAQLLAGLTILLQFPTACFFYATPSLILVTLYPLAKRVTYYPQCVLGLTFSWGAIMGFPALGIDLLNDSTAMAAAACLYAGNVAWTVLYDMIYAHMDIRDDARAGIKSIALRHEASTKAVLTGLAVVQVGMLALVGNFLAASPIFYLGACGGAAAVLGNMIRRVRLEEVKDCWWWFVNGAWMTGGVVAIGIGGEYVVRYQRDEQLSPDVEHEHRISS